MWCYGTKSQCVHRRDAVSKARQTVLKAITEGRLPAESVPIAGGRRVYLIDPADAEALWSTDIRVSA